MMLSEERPAKRLPQRLPQRPAKRPAESPGGNTAKRPERVAHSTNAGTLRQKKVLTIVAADANITMLSVAGVPSIMPATASQTDISDSPSCEDRQIERMWKITKEDVVLPPEIAASFEMRKVNPSAFLRIENSQTPSSLLEHYDYTVSLRDSIITNRIQWRFITTAYYDVMSDLSSSSRHSITKAAVGFVVAVICSLSSHHWKGI